RFRPCLYRLETVPRCCSSGRVARPQTRESHILLFALCRDSRMRFLMSLVHDRVPPIRRVAFVLIALALLPALSHGNRDLLTETLRAADEPDFKDELPRIAPHEPAEALSTFRTLPGFHMEQVAAEPLVH